MADKKISQLTPATHVDGVDLGVVVQAGQTLKFDYDLLVALIQASISVGSEFTFGTAIPQNTDGNDGDVYFKTDTLAFYRKVAGTWSVVFTFPTIGDGTLLYGTLVPSPTLTGSKNGDSYINTSTGIFYKKASGTWTQVFSMASGPQGPQGTDGTNGTNGVDGKTILNGTTNPSNLIGNNGDFYINSATLMMFGPKAAGVWGTGLTLVGPIGPGVPNGGTTAQVLKKVDNTDQNTAWGSVNFSEIGGNATDNTSLSTALSGKVDKVVGKQLSTEDYTTAEKSKLAALSEHYVGYYASLSALNIAHPTGVDGQYATVDAGVGSDAKTYIWDDNDNAWILGSGSGGVTSVNSQVGVVILTTDDIGEGSTNKYFTAARVLATILAGISFGSSAAVTAADSILIGIGKLQAQITALLKIPTGGTANQILAKIDGTDGNTQWVDQELIDTALTGLAISVVGTTATVTAGTWRIANITYSKGTSTNITIPAQDATLSRYTVIYADNTGAISSVNGTLSADPVEPGIPAGSVEIGYILITPTSVTVGGTGKKGTGTVTSVTSANTDLNIVNNTTTPVITLKKVNGIGISFYDPTSSIQTQLNSKAPLASPALTGVPTAPTANPGTTGTQLATVDFVARAVLAQNSKEAAIYATTAALPSSTYNNGSSGVGATLTSIAFGALSIDGNTPSIGDRILVKNQASTFQNGIYVVTVVGSVSVAFVLTRSTDFNSSDEIKTGDSVYVKSGTANGATTWDVNSSDSPVMGTNPITFAQTAGPGSFVSGNGITIIGNSIAIDTTVTVDKTTVQTLTNKALSTGVTGVTQSPNDNSISLATTAYVDAAIAAQAKKTVLGSYQSIV